MARTEVPNNLLIYCSNVTNYVLKALLVHSKHGLVLRGVLTLQPSDESIGKAAITSTLYPASHPA